MTFTLNIKSAAEIEAAARDRAYAALADYRWQRETGGLTLADGSRVLTTREAQSQISNAVQSISSGLITDPVTWKLASGWAGAGTGADHRNGRGGSRSRQEVFRGRAGRGRADGRHGRRPRRLRRAGRIRCRL